VDEELENDLRDAKEKRRIDQFPATAAIFFPEGKPVIRGTKLPLPDLAATIERIASNGASDFYEGEIAKRLVETFRQDGGNFSFRDLREYKPVWRAPLKIRFGEYSIYTMAPPSAGGLVLAESLNILAGFDLAKAGFQTPGSIHLLAEATRRAYIDRNRYLGDPSTTRIPMRDLLSNARAAKWRSTIDPRKATATVSLSEPALTVAEGDHTTHFTIVDTHGNIASVTTTLNENFGSGYIVPGLGFLLNNEMDDFSPAPGKPNRYGMVQSAANAIEPGKRMISSMTPAIVFRGERPFLALGTRGGPAIPTTVLQVLLNVIVYKKSLVDAIAAPRYHQQGLPEDIAYELKRAPESILAALRERGHGVAYRESIGDVHAIAIEGGRIIAVADPRRGGAAGGF
jgi:gamma-glutamyltranspeptidase/glutathione hydrolase